MSTLLWTLAGLGFFMAFMRSVITADNYLREHGWLKPEWEFQREAALTNKEALLKNREDVRNFWKGN